MQSIYVWKLDDFRRIFWKYGLRWEFVCMGLVEKVLGEERSRREEGKGLSKVVVWSKVKVWFMGVWFLNRVKCFLGLFFFNGVCRLLVMYCLGKDGYNFLGKVVVLSYRQLIFLSGWGVGGLIQKWGFGLGFRIKLYIELIDVRVYD